MTESRYSPTTTFVPALPEPRLLSPAPTQPIEVATILPPIAHSGHARQDDDALTHAKATLLVSSAYIVATLLITVGLLLIAWLFRALGDKWATYTFTGLIVWGMATLLALWGNRRQALWNSPTGIAHHELDSRERIALHAIDAHARLLLTRWEVEHRGR